MKTRKAHAYLVAVFSILIITAAPAATEKAKVFASIERGTIEQRYPRECRAPAEYLCPPDDFIFDGDQWIKLWSERGLKLNLELQHERDPGMLE